MLEKARKSYNIIVIQSTTENSHYTETYIKIELKIIETELNLIKSFDNHLNCWDVNL